MTTQICAYVALPDDEKTASKSKLNPKFLRLVHAYTKKARPPHLSPEEERNAIRQVQDFGCQESLELLVRSFTDLCVATAVKAVQQTGAQEMADDFYNVAVEALIKAIHKCDLEKYKNRLSSYAKISVAGEVRRFEMRYRKSITFGTNLNDKRAYMMLGRIRKEFETQFGRPMSDTLKDYELAAQISGVPARSIRRVIELRSRNQMVPADHIQIFDPFGKSDPEMCAIRNSGRTVIAAEINSLLEALPPRDAHIFSTMVQDYGNRKQHAETLAEHYSLTSERIRQIDRACFQLLRENLAKKGVMDSTDLTSLL